MFVPILPARRVSLYSLGKPNQSDGEHDQRRSNKRMASDKKTTGSSHGSNLASKDDQSPEWASGLKQLYDSVVEEPLPDAFKDLLDKLDDVDASNDGGGAT